MRAFVLPLALVLVGACSHGEPEPFGICVQPALGQGTARYYDYYGSSSSGYTVDDALSVSGAVIATGAGEAPSGPCGRWVGLSQPSPTDLEWFVLRDPEDGSVWEVTVSLPGSSGPPDVGANVHVDYAFQAWTFGPDLGWARVEDAEGLRYWASMSDLEHAAPLVVEVGDRYRKEPDPCGRVDHLQTLFALDGEEVVLEEADRATVGPFEVGVGRHTATGRYDESCADWSPDWFVAWAAR